MPRDQPQPGSFLNKREEPGNEVVRYKGMRLFAFLNKREQPGNEVVRYPVSHTAAEGKQKKVSRRKR